MFKIAICDDEAAICEQLESILQRIGSEFLKDLEWDVFFSGESLYDYLKKDKYYDIIFLDIELKEMNGVEVGHIVRHTMANETTQIVLQRYKFIQIHKTYLVNYYYITKFEYDKVTLSNKVSLPISQANGKRIRRFYLELEGESIWD